VKRCIKYTGNRSLLCSPHPAIAQWSPRHNSPNIKVDPVVSHYWKPAHTGATSALFDRYSAFTAASLTVARFEPKSPTYLHTNPVYLQRNAVSEIYLLTAYTDRLTVELAWSLLGLLTAGMVIWAFGQSQRDAVLLSNHRAAVVIKTCLSAMQFTLSLTCNSGTLRHLITVHMLTFCRQVFRT